MNATGTQQRYGNLVLVQLHQQSSRTGQAWEGPEAMVKSWSNHGQTHMHGCVDPGTHMH